MKRIFLIITFIVSILTSLLVLKTPSPANTLTQFDAVTATSHLSKISQKPHSVYDYYNHEEVRQYLLEESINYVGEENVVTYNYQSRKQDNKTLYKDLYDDEFTYNMGYHDFDVDYDVKNVLAKIPGKSDTGILVVGHYDSRGHVGRPGELGNSYGAADDGYALITMLEILRIFSNKELENSIYVLFTDAEETGLHGSKLAAKEKDIMDNVNFVLNIEARGIKGASFMFETSKNNSKVIQLYKHAYLPVSYSIATAVYQVMPNSTDFTSFIDEGKAGANFAVLDSLDYYHTPNDNFNNISITSISHYMSQILPMVSEYSSNSEYSDMNYFDSNKDMVFFTLFSNVLITYSSLTSIILSLLVLIVFVYLLVYKLKPDFKLLGKNTMYFFTFLIFMMIFGLFSSKYIALIGGAPFNLTYLKVANSNLYFIGFTIITALILYYINKLVKFINYDYILYSSIFVNGLISLLISLVLPGASYLFLIPAILATIYLAFNIKGSNKYINYTLFFIITLIFMCIFVPHIYALNISLTIGALAIINTIFVFAYTVYLPIYKQFKALK